MTHLRSIAWALVVMMLGHGSAWACKPPDDITGFSVESITHRAVTVAFDPPSRGHVVVRLDPTPPGWGSLAEVACKSSPCVIEDLDPETHYDVRAVPALVTQTRGTIYGTASSAQAVTTMPEVTLKDALLDGVDYCLSRKLAHTACFKALNDALRKVTQ